MNKDKALVTGGCGFVGRHFVKRLLSMGYHVTVVDDLSTGIHPSRWPAHLKFNSTDDKSFLFCHADFREFTKSAEPNYDLIIHLAAVVGGRVTIESDPLKVATDLSIDATFFNWVVKKKPLPKKVLYFSSSAVYPVCLQNNGNCHPLSEELINFESASIGIPDMTYGWSKLSGEYLANHAVRSYDLDVVIYRPFSGYGEDQDLTYPFPSIVRRIAEKNNPVVIWGSGNQLRDFIYIEDVVSAVFESFNRLGHGEVINLGSGVGTSFRVLAEIACILLGHNSAIINDSTKPEGVFNRVGDCRRMLRYYVPKVSLEEGIKIVYDFQTRENTA
jgi:nucleoside-diphosphate-sugar epimerase